MAIVRMTLEQATASITDEQRADYNRRIDATTEEDIRRQMIEDGEDPDAEPGVNIHPTAIRKRIGLTQADFAAIIGIPVGTLRNWEQNRVTIEPAARALLIILAREPEAALRALRPRTTAPCS